MSQEATAWVWLNSTTRGANRLVFLALAHSADTNGEGVVPSYPTIAQMCALPSVSAVGRAINSLIDIREIEVDPRQINGEYLIFNIPAMAVDR
jgi:hypothetical protein